MTRGELFEQIQRKHSYLCIGLDTDLTKIPKHLLQFDDPVFEFNRQIIEATSDFCIGYKPNLAFYECLGPKGLQSLEKTVRCIPENMFTIADAKRGDIGNTSLMYAKTFFEHYRFDAVTVAPYMGSDSVKPFLEFKNKWTILLLLTSNAGADDFQKSEIKNRRRLVLLQADPKRPEESLDAAGSGMGTLFGEVLSLSKDWGTPDNMMYVVGATQSELFSNIRKSVPEHFLLVPGIGAQGGNLEEVSKHGMNKQCGLIVNSSRQIIYASGGEDFAEKARAEAMKMQEEMQKHLHDFLK